MYTISTLKKSIELYVYLLLGRIIRKSTKTESIELQMKLGSKFEGL
jgi:hypothetical protein